MDVAGNMCYLAHLKVKTGAAIPYQEHLIYAGSLLRSTESVRM